MVQGKGVWGKGVWGKGVGRKGVWGKGVGGKGVQGKGVWGNGVWRKGVWGKCVQENVFPKCKFERNSSKTANSIRIREMIREIVLGLVWGNFCEEKILYKMNLM